MPWANEVSFAGWTCSKVEYNFLNWWVRSSKMGSAFWMNGRERKLTWLWWRMMGLGQSAKSWESILQTLGAKGRKTFLMTEFWKKNGRNHWISFLSSWHLPKWFTFWQLHNNSPFITNENKLLNARGKLWWSIPTMFCQINLWLKLTKESPLIKPLGWDPVKLFPMPVHLLTFARQENKNIDWLVLRENGK